MRRNAFLILPFVSNFFVFLFLVSHLLFCASPDTALSIKVVRKKCLQAINNIRSLEAAFYQKTKKGEISGKVFLKRAGKSGAFGNLFLSYDAPSDLEILSTGRQIYMHRRLTNETSRLPITSSPLTVLLGRSLRLGQFVQEKALRFDKERVLWTLYDPQERDRGHVTLVFSLPSFTLEGWHVFDAYGKTTQVVLRKTVINKKFDDHFFRKKYQN